jgi:hypothetical protein
MSRKYVDFKVTTWCRAYLEEDVDLDQVVEALKSGEGSNYLFAKELAYEWENLVDTEVSMKLEENNGNATIEVYEDDKEIWNNAQK